MSWIKVRNDLITDPAVYRIASITGLDRFSVVGRLTAFWSWADQHAVDGVVDGGSSQVVDDVTSHDGFSAALQQVKWLHVDADKLVIPNHDRHNGATAKERSLKSERQARWRAKQDPEKTEKPVDGDVDGKAPTREEKRRGEKNTPLPPKGGQVEIPDWMPAKPWEDFVAMRRAKGQKIPFTVAAAKGIVAKLAEFREAGHDPGAILTESVINGWSGVFEPKAGKTAARPAEGFV